MLRVSIIAALSVPAAPKLAGQAAGRQSPSEIFQRALVLERTNGRLDSAIVLYELVARTAGRDRAMAGRALLSAGRAYEALGRSEARKVYERLIRDFADQADLATQARTRLAALAENPSSESTSRNPGAPATRVVWSGLESSPNGTPSPDGRYVSFTDWKTGDLAVHDLTTGRDRRLTNKGSWAESSALAYWSMIAPDGKRVAFSWDAGEKGVDRTELRVVPLAGGASRLVPIPPQYSVQPYCWSADGKQIVAGIQREKSDNGSLVLIDVANGSVTTLRRFGSSRSVGAAMSPDGKMIAFDIPARDEPGATSDIHVIASDGTGEHALVDHPASDWSPYWTPDGRGVLFLTDRTGSWGVWMVDVANGSARDQPYVVRADFGRTFPVGFARDGRFFYAPLPLLDVLTAEIDPETGRVVRRATNPAAKHVGSHLLPDWSPDGSQLAMLSYRGSGQGLPGTRALEIVDVATSESRDLWPPLENFFNPRWSPDGASILLPGTNAAHTGGLFRVDVRSGSLSTIALGDDFGRLADWSHDGRSIYYTRQDSSVFSLWRFDVADSTRHVVFNPPRLKYVRSLAFSRDGRQAAFTAQIGDSTTSMLLTLGTGALSPLPLGDRTGVGKPGGYNSLDFVSDGSLIGTKYRLSDDMMTIWRIPLDGRPARKLAYEFKSVGNTRFTPDGRRVGFAVASAEGMMDLWVAENLVPRKK